MRLTREGVPGRLGILAQSASRSTLLVAAIVLLLAAVLGALASPTLLILLGSLLGGLLLLRLPALGVVALVVISLILPVGLPTGTAVELNLATLLVPGLVVLVIIVDFRRREFRDWTSRTFLPMYLLLVALAVSMLVGNVTWDIDVPRSSAFWVVQVAQIAVFAISAAALWLGSMVFRDRGWMQVATWSFVALAGFLGALTLFPAVFGLVDQWITGAITRAPFWVLLFAVAGGQYLFNDRLSQRQRAGLLPLMVIVLVNVFFIQREAASNWVGISAVVAAFVWLKWPRFRWVALFVVVFLIFSGLLVPTVWQFAGGEVEWRTSGASRLLLIERVLADTMRNPVLGLGPAAYRAYGATRPLAYQQAFWIVPEISSHNNFVDLFSHAGLVGLGLFLWFAFELGRLGLNLRGTFRTGFEAGFVNGMLAAGVGSLALMMLADWILPFVYNIGFEGLQASGLVWLFIGGLVALDHRRRRTEGKPVA